MTAQGSGPHSFTVLSLAGNPLLSSRAYDIKDMQIDLTGIQTVQLGKNQLLKTQLSKVTRQSQCEHCTAFSILLL